MNEPPLVVAVTGASGYVGTGLLRALEQEERVEQILALDSRPLAIPFRNVTAQRVDIADLDDDTFQDRRVTSVVHLAFQLRQGHRNGDAEKISQANLESIEGVLRACKAAKINNLIFLSSHTVYGAHRNNPIPITEEANTDPLPGFRYALDKRACEEKVLEYAHANPEVSVAILRSCVVLGPAADNYITRTMFGPLLLRVLGYDPPLQFVHEDDLSRLLHHMVMVPRTGIFNVAGDGIIPYSQVARLASHRMLALPAALAYPLVQMAWTLGVQKDAPSVGLDFIRFPMVMSTGKLKGQGGFRFSYTSAEAVQSYLNGAAL